jgi:hypothetical protein
MRRSATRRWIRAGGAAVLLVAAATVVPAGADSPAGNYVGVATASGARATFVVPGEFAVEEVMDAGGPVAQSRLGGGAADSFASFPYPGGTAIAYQGLLAIATGLSSPFAYPFYVSAADPAQPKQEVVDPSGSYSLKATAAPASTTAAAALRPGGPGALVAANSATTSVVAEGDSVVATASSLAEGLSLGDNVLSVGGVASRSITKLTGGAPPATETELTVTGLRVGDKRVGVGPTGFELLGTPVPLPSAEVAKLIADTLKPAGLQLRFVAPEAIAGGARAAAIEIVSQQAPPNMPASELTIRLGGALSAITQGEGTVPLPDTGPVAAPGTPSGDTGPSQGSSPVPAAGPLPAGSGGDAAAASALGVPTSTGAAPDSSPAGTFPGGPFAAGTGTGDNAPAGAVTAPASDQAAAPVTLGSGGSGSTLEAAPIVSPRRVSALGLLYAVVAALGLSALVGAGAWTLRGRWPA